MYKISSFFTATLLRLFKRTILICSLLVSHFSYAEIDLAEINAHLPEGTSLGFVAKNLNRNEKIVAHQASTFMLPASTQKVLTALTAKLVLSDQFQFETSLLTNGKIKNNEMHGDLIVRFTGDPDLTSGQLYQLFAQLKKQRIQKISGDIILDTSVFSSHDRGLGWIWNDLTMCFNAPPAAVNIDNNCFYVELDANYAPGEQAKIHVPAQYPVQVFGQVYISTPKEAGYCQLDATVLDNNRYQLKGCLARQNKPFGLSFAIQDPNAYAATIIQRHLKKLGIAFNGKIKQPYQTQKGQLLAQHLSKPLPDLIKKMMKKSDNQIADALFRTIAYQYYQRPASFPLASQAMRQILQTKAGIKFGHAIIADGSGLSHHNLLSADILLQALEYIAKHETQLQLMDTFPIAAVDGTLTGRGSLIHEPLAKNLIAKTGALKGVYNLAGFMTNKKGEKVAFVQFINGYSTGDFERKTKRAPLVQFESQIYNRLYEH
ncbi:serine-type D-Ala-D-Ala carboxypeptidase [Pasteurella multocida]|uniref:serine-type D-Ala-D-Ala carboxypeptidase n=1 Tax=Pasteurella multocida TaxID=747 RepID=UPI00189B4EE6|nr:serine-type D-Ala-D-Ala carboxypeptidase [Pasteurella multocida]MBF6980037.1 serine-type D-Ala-D-Ala carboxypeptidase [Pasteurella multocida]